MSRRNRDEPHENEVRVREGFCVTWRCYNPSPAGPECPEHAAEPLPGHKRPPGRTAMLGRKYKEDAAWREQENARNRDKNRRARADPAYRERENRLKRERRAARRQRELEEAA